MNCAKCIKPNATGRQGHGFKLSQVVKLLKLKAEGDHEQWQCPKCKAKFWFEVSNRVPIAV